VERAAGVGSVWGGKVRHAGNRSAAPTQAGLARGRAATSRRADRPATPVAVPGPARQGQPRAGPRAGTLQPMSSQPR
jgi:hypothetical protein